MRPPQAALYAPSAVTIPSLMNVMRIQTLEDLRTDLPMMQRYAYFQTGSYAPAPESTQCYMTEQFAMPCGRHGG
jgi:hypothetical protein